MRYAMVGTVLLAGCAAFADPSGRDATLAPPSVPPPLLGTAGAAAPVSTSGVAGGFSLAGVDNALTPVTTSAAPPAPINGGTLLIAKDGHTAVAADPDRDRISIVDLSARQVLATVALQQGDEPGRMTEDSAGRVHVVLRKTGDVSTIDLATRSVIARRHVCQVPQGIAYDAASDALLVACSEGALVTLPAGDGEVSKRELIDQDLRDVIISQGHRYVSRFKSAELIDLVPDAVALRSNPQRIKAPFNSSALGTPRVGDAASPSFEATVAWRTLSMPDGRVVMLHERAQATAIALSLEDPHGTDSGSDSDGGAPNPPVPDAPGTTVPGFGTSGGSPYGGGDGDQSGCDSIVRPALSMSNGPGTPLRSGPVLPFATLAVDAAVSSDGHWLAIAVAGSRNPNGLVGQVGAMVVDTNQLSLTSEVDGAGICEVPGLDAGGGVIAAGQVIGVAFDGQDRLVMQTREPNTLRVMAEFNCIGCDAGSDTTTIDLGGEPRLDSGHELFHQDAGAGIACASCHPGGGDDGHTWVFDTVGARRTQLFNMGIRDTLPLHWDGEFASLGDLVDEVFSRRMGGPQLDAEHVAALGDWIETLSPNARMRAGDDASAQRGKRLFESPDVGCTGCHNGAMLTNNATVDVGTGGAFQVPSLIGVAYHQPYLHNGCANTLRERFVPTCGGDKHGNTADLNDAQIDDLVAFLQTL